jgi:hypothetical protein
MLGLIKGKSNLNSDVYLSERSRDIDTNSGTNFGHGGAAWLRDVPTMSRCGGEVAMSPDAQGTHGTLSSASTVNMQVIDERLVKS